MKQTKRNGPYQGKALVAERRRLKSSTMDQWPLGVKRMSRVCSHSALGVLHKATVWRSEKSMHRLWFWHFLLPGRKAKLDPTWLHPVPFTESAPSHWFELQTNSMALFNSQHVSLSIQLMLVMPKSVRLLPNLSLCHLLFVGGGGQKDQKAISKVLHGKRKHQKLKRLRMHLSPM